MSMSDIMSSLGLAVYPIIGMALFLSVFVGVVIRTAGSRRRDELDRAAHLPLADDASVCVRSTSTHQSSIAETRA